MSKVYLNIPNIVSENTVNEFRKENSDNISSTFISFKEEGIMETCFVLTKEDANVTFKSASLNKNENKLDTYKNRLVSALNVRKLLEEKKLKEANSTKQIF